MANIKQRIAVLITIVTVSGTVILGGLGIWLAFRSENKSENLQYIFGALLPLWGTWIGTILAYYFSKENFETASKNTKEVLDKVMTSSQKLKMLKVTEVMIPFGKMTVHQIKENDMNEIRLKELRETMKSENRLRLPIINKSRHVEAVVHKSTIDHYFADIICEHSGLNQPDPSLGQAREKDQYLNMVLTYGRGYISMNASLLDAQRLMEKTPVCNDIFITETGKAKEPVLGWITNMTIAEKAQLE